MAGVAVLYPVDQPVRFERVPHGKPLAENSGFHATWSPVAASSEASRAAVPTGTVDLPTTRLPARATRAT